MQAKQEKPKATIPPNTSMVKLMKFIERGRKKIAKWTKQIEEEKTNNAKLRSMVLELMQKGEN